MNESNIIRRMKAGKFTLIAEIGVNYYDIASKLSISLMEAAKLMILSAHNAGIKAVKFQTYKAENLASKFSPSYWDTSEETITSQYELFRKFDTFGEPEYRYLSSFCKKVGIEFLSTAFDFASADYLEPMMNVYKISSSDISNIPFIEYMAKKNKPILLSVGASNLDEVQMAVATIRKYNKKELALLHCVLEYPTPYQHANLCKITGLQRKFPDVYIGYSDHTKPDECYDVIKMAYILGATVIEKHFTLDKTLTGNDHYHAMDPKDAENILAGISFIDKLKGNEEIKCLQSELIARENARRSIVAAVNIQEGVKITRDMLTFKRPGYGISPNEIDKVIGKYSSKKIEKDTVFEETLLR